MNIDKFWMIGLIVFASVTLMAFLIFVIGFSSVTRPMISSGQADIGNFTDNATYWTGFSSSFSAAPLLIWLIFGGMVVYALWRLISPHIRPKT